ncbi:hypothetical protein [Spirosoma foliorum]|uniref:Uncharacterized protein n=1 Tax=Spirosoma foliorum TaxID=2710596 RepID=A0A7G5H6G6_9BACT|nr:hypothetical protein [Spirosoma foliorum]QMW06708.1 hypothetical protein H3H32_18350 [Spirosoma foliorum]
MANRTKDHFAMLYRHYLKQVQVQYDTDPQIMMATEQLIARANRQTALTNRQRDNSPNTVK